MQATHFGGITHVILSILVNLRDLADAEDLIN